MLRLQSWKPRNVIQLIGHCAYGYEVTGKFDVCEACSIAKARQKNINKEWKGGNLIRGERLYVDISSIKETSFGGSKFWALIIDDFSNYVGVIF
jgi:hypothetical protein